MISQILRTTALCSILATHVAAGVIARRLVRGRVAYLRLSARYVSRHALWAMKLFRIRLEIEGQAHAKPGQNYLIVCNHMSYADVLPLAVFRPSAFVTSVEMREDPVLGPITETGACLYVERRSKENIHSEIGEIEMALRAGLNVVIFPEATSTNGEALRPFKRPLFAAAARAGVPVLPVVLQYERLNGNPVTTANRDTICWYGSMPFASHFFGLMCQQEIGLRLKILAPIPAEAGSTRDTLMDAAEAAIRQNYQPIQGAV